MFFREESTRYCSYGVVCMVLVDAAYKVRDGCSLAKMHVFEIED